MTENRTNPNSALVADALNVMNAKLADVNNAIKENDLDKVNSTLEALRKSEKEYLKARRDEVFFDLKHTENPIKEAVVAYSFATLTASPNRTEDGVLVDYELKNKEKLIDLAAFCKYCGKETLWTYDLELLNQLLTMKVAEELGMSAAEIKRIAKSYYLSEKAREKANGGTPTSPTQLVKMLQKVFDGLLFEDNGKGKNVYKVNNHDIAYIFASYSKKNKKEVLNITVSKHRELGRLFADVAHRVLTDKKYGLTYQSYTKQQVEKMKEDSKKKSSKESKKQVVKEVADEVSPVIFDETIVSNEEGNESAE